MKPESYVYSPNNIYGIEGREIYPAGADVKQPASPLLAFDMGDSINLYSTVYGEPCALTLCCKYDSVEAFERYCDTYGVPSPQALPAYYNSDI